MLLYLELSTVVAVITGTLLVLVLLFLLLLARLPVMGAVQGISFIIPGSPWVPASVLVLVLGLLVQTLPSVTFIVAPYFIFGKDTCNKR